MTWQTRSYAVLLMAALFMGCFTHSAAAQATMPMNYGGSDSYGAVIDATHGGGIPTYGNVAPVYIPPPPTPEPSYQLGFRYWWSTGKTSFDINSDRQGLKDNPSSHLNYDSLQGNTGEITLRAKNDTNYFFTGFFGGGWLSGGNLTDINQVAGTSTRSNVDDNGLLYGTMDLDKQWTVYTRGPEVQVNPFIGFNYWQEDAVAYGCQQISGTNAGCGGSSSLSNSAKFATNNMHWASLRLGAEVKAKLFNRLTLIGNAALLPVAYLWNDENRYFVPKGPLNIEDQGTGWGYQLEGSAQLDLSCNWALAAGVRYWYAETDGSSKETNLGGQADLHNFKADRLGVFAALNYSFSSF